MSSQSKSEKLAKNAIIITIGKLSTQAITFFLLPVYTHYLTTEQYGTVDLLTTLVSLLLPIVTLQFEQGVFRYLIDCRKDDARKKELISTSFVFIAVQCVLMISIFCVVGHFINNDYKWFLLANVIAAIFSSLLLQITRGVGDNAGYAIGCIVTSGSTIVFNILFITIFNMNAYGMLLGTFLGHVLGVAYLMIKEKIYLYVKRNMYNKAVLFEVLRYSFPLVPTMLSWWIVNVSDRFLINIFINMNANGIYSVSNKFSSIITMFYGFFNLSWTESVSININSSDAEKFINDTYKKIVRLVGGLCAFSICAISIAFDILVDANFSDAYYQVPLLILAAFFCNLSSFEGGIYIAKKQSKKVAKSTLAAAAINIAINLVMIKQIGLYAASLSSVIAYLFIYLYRIIDLRKIVTLKMGITTASAVLVAFVISFISYYVKNQFISVVACLIVAAISIYINKKTICHALRMVLGKTKRKTQ